MMFTRKQIREQLIGAQEKKALLIEGRTDNEAFEIFLRRFVPAWDQRWVLAPAGGKRELLKILTEERDWLGLVDRDEWDQPAIDKRVAAQPNLLVLPRFCIENYLIHPDELWQAIPPARKAEIAGGQASLKQAIESSLPQYLRHGALWKAVTPLWSGLRALGFKEALASEDSLLTAQDDAQIRSTLGEWDNLLDPDRIFDDFQTHLRNAQATSLENQIAQWVHGKVFWKKVVNPAMNRLLGQMEEGERRKKILRKLPLPADLKPILNRLG